MPSTRIERLAPLTGAVSFVLFIVAALLVNNYDYLPPAAELKSFFQDGATRLGVAAYLGLIAAVFLIWFAGSVRDSLRGAEGKQGRLSAVAFGGGVASAALVALGFAVLAVAAARAGTSEGLNADVAAFAYDIYGAILGNALAVTLAALFGASTVVAFRSGAWPSWVVWTGAVLTVGSISPVAYIFIVLDVVWILVLSIFLYTRGRAESVMPS